MSLKYQNSCSGVSSVRVYNFITLPPQPLVGHFAATLCYAVLRCATLAYLLFAVWRPHAVVNDKFPCELWFFSSIHCKEIYNLFTLYFWGVCVFPDWRHWCHIFCECWSGLEQYTVCAEHLVGMFLYFCANGNFKFSGIFFVFRISRRALRTCNPVSPLLDDKVQQYKLFRELWKTTWNSSLIKPVNTYVKKNVTNDLILTKMT